VENRGFVGYFVPLELLVKNREIENEKKSTYFEPSIYSFKIHKIEDMKKRI
jgi:hypothetical protein